MEGPSKEFADPERQELIKLIAEDHFKLFQTKDVSPALYAFIWLADIEKLRETAPGSIAPMVVLLNPGFLKLAIQQWLQKGRSGSKASSKASSVTETSPALIPRRQRVTDPDRIPLTTSTVDVENTSAAPIKARSKRALKLTEERDKGCIVQRVPCVDVAHIFPSSLRDSHVASPLIQTLRCFWKEEHVDAWLKAAYGAGTESPHNLICLSPTAHRLHGNALFAFKFKSYVETENTRALELNFYWLKHAEPRTTVPLTEVPSLDLEAPSDIGLYNYQKGLENGHHVKSGEIVRMETDDPERKPLPLQPLLQMQWLLNRVAALSAAAEPDDLE
ncbi:predicted protein [Uncinocarpus reesii 1704]|uniref:HNH nuclease domain-containing protein n=1 Tax=Uncinocarpus reesii (strain UAMH 1704) TaxID=336963 RepID=C4JWK1_UNCRE|nr:uncharacterized protein UREG_06943 [Uncinocarpus reesii 1704]EEP82078.1 predicted protein [Uncinocarpus reesii 1704]